MNSFLQPSIKNYLIEALQTNLTSNPANEYYNTLKDYYVISEAEDGSTRANAEVDKKDNRVDPSKAAPVSAVQQSAATATQPKPKKQKKSY